MINREIRKKDRAIDIRITGLKGTIPNK